MFDLDDERRGLGLLDLRADPSPGDTWMRVLGAFNQCMVGLIRFQGETPWEILEKDQRRETTLSAGQICIVPANCWHRQHARSPVSLLYVTSREHNAHSSDEMPEAVARSAWVGQG